MVSVRSEVGGTFLMRNVLLATALLLPAVLVPRKAVLRRVVAPTKGAEGITGDTERLACFDRIFREQSEDRRGEAVRKVDRERELRQQFGLNKAVIEERERKKGPGRPPTVTTIQAAVMRAMSTGLAIGPSSSPTAQPGGRPNWFRLFGLPGGARS